MNVRSPLHTLDAELAASAGVAGVRIVEVNP